MTPLDDWKSGYEEGLRAGHHAGARDVIGLALAAACLVVLLIVLAAGATR
jgi:hypothetical protein